MWIFWCRFLKNALCAAISFGAFFSPNLWGASALEWKLVSPSAPNHAVRVGDVLELGLSGFDSNPLTIQSVRLPPGAQGFREQGWVLVSNAVPTVEGASIRIIPVRPSEPKGSVTLSSLEIVDAEGKVIGKTLPFSLAVQAPTESQEPPPDWMGPGGIEVPWATVIALGALVLVLVSAAAWGVFRWFRKRSKLAPGPPTVSAPPLSADAWALRELQLLEERRYIQLQEWKKFHYGLSDIFKGYLSRRFEFDAQKSTTEECVAYLSRLESSLPAGGCSRVQTVFDRMDQVKFTNLGTQSLEAQQVLDQVRQWIQESKGHHAL